MYIKLVNLAVSLSAMFLSAYVFMTLFNWFAVPTLGFLEIKYAGAFGLSLFIGFIRAKITTEDMERSQKEVDDTTEFARLVTIIITDLLALGVGAIVQLAM